MVLRDEFFACGTKALERKWTNGSLQDKGKELEIL